MTTITNLINTDEFNICYGYIGSYESVDMTLRGNGIANEWVYCVIQSMDSSDNPHMKYIIHDRNNGDREIICSHKQGINFRPYFNNKVTAINNGNNLLYYVAFNPIPYTQNHDFTIIEESTDLGISEKTRYIIPIIGKCIANGNEITALNFGRNTPGKNLTIRLQPGDITAIITRL
jgi:hypothetical protein